MSNSFKGYDLGARKTSLSREELARAALIIKMVADQNYAEITKRATQWLRMANGKEEQSLTFLDVRAILAGIESARKMDDYSQIEGSLAEMSEIEAKMLVLERDMRELFETSTEMPN